MKKYAFLFFIFYGCQPEKELIFIKSDFLGYANNTGRPIDGKDLDVTEVYYIKNFTYCEKAYKAINDFALKNKSDSSINKCLNYGIVFYKYSNETNDTNLRANPRQLDRYSQQHDLICDYNWSLGKFIEVYWYKNGRLVKEGYPRREPDEIKIEDVKP